MRKFFGVKVVGLLAAFGGFAVCSALAGTGISFTGALYEEGFDGLPTQTPGGGGIPQSNSLQTATAFPDGWQDDVIWQDSPEVDLSVPGWYLHHPTSNTEGGFNGNQRFRMGTGNSGTGSFYGFAPSSGTAEKALGAVGSTNMAANGEFMYMGLRLINNTGQSLNQFTLTFDGEQWRDGDGGVESLLFGFSTSADVNSWYTPSALFTSVPELTFTAPVTAGTNSGNIGNTTGLVPNISATVTNFTWEPGEELWLRWADEQIAGNDDGMAIDNVRFIADAGGVFGSNDVNSAQSGLASLASTWSDNQAPSAGKIYRVVSGHTVTLDGDFAGPQLRVRSGGTVDFGAAASGASIPVLRVEDGGNLTKSAVGSYQIGYLDSLDTPLNALELQGDAALSVDAGSTLILGMNVKGAGNLDLNTGAGSNVRMVSSEEHGGILRFNGAGDELSLEWNRDHGVIEMNSTGANRFNYLQTGNVDAGTLIFNQPGTVVHGTTVASPSSRLVNLSGFAANAAVTIDLSTPLVTGNSNSERRFLITGEVSGSADITIVGMATDPSNVNTSVGLHEFEVGSSGEPSNIPVDSYSGTMTMGGYVNVELRHSMPAAKFVVNENARFEMGHDVTATTKEISFGQVTVNSGGILEIGHEDNLTTTTGHVTGKLRLTTSGGESGDLILNPGSKTVMNITAAPSAPARYDSVFAEGDIQLGGVLELWFNPETTGDPGAVTTYTPVLNDEFVIMSLVGGTSPAADFDASGTVDAGDLAQWKTSFGDANNGADADGDGDSDGADLLAWQRTLGEVGTSSGTITGNFTDVIAPTELGAEWPAGLDFDTVVVGNEVRLRVISVPAIAAIPEPASIALVILGSAGLLATRRKQRMPA